MAVHKGGTGDAASMHVEASDFHRVLLASRDFDKKLYAALRKQIRLAGAEVVADVRKGIDQIPSEGKYGRGLRSALKKGTKVAIQSGGKTGNGAGIRITTGAKGYPAGAMNKASFRHPVFGNAARNRNDWAWVRQSGRPYFGAVIESHQSRMRDRVREAIEEAASQMAADVEH